ncbi:MAG: HAMP domain-containing protein [Acidobacteria bacterium]|nr:HAMP domain-containing protein [Acidobacteriota bacterium]
MRSRGLLSRLLAAQLAVTLGALAVAGVACGRLLERRAMRALERRLVAEARLANASIAGLSDQRLQDAIRAIGEASGTRFTVVAGDGVVLADSEHDPATMENHAGRPEIRGALAGDVGSDERVSDMLGGPFLYVALPPNNDMIVRAALPATAAVEQERHDVLLAILVVSTAMAGVAIVVSALLALSLARPLRRMGRQMLEVMHGERRRIDPSGPHETRALAEAVNGLASDLASRIDQLRAETTLREEILSTMGEGVLLAASGGDLLYANRAAARLLGANRLTRMPTQLAEPGAFEFTLHFPERRDLRTMVVRLPDQRMLAVVQDVTKERRLDLMRRDFVANASHELKTPVASILAAAETIAAAAGTDPDAVPRFAEALVREAQRLAHMVRDLLDLARLEQRHAAAREEVDLAGVVRREAEAFREAAEAKGLALRVETIGSAVVPGDAEDLGLLVRNLLDNAVRYTASGRIDVRVSANGGVTLEVSDTGVGIPEADVPRIFERFQRVDRARSRETGGTGLGLAIVRHVAESHGARVHVTSELGRGSCFTVAFPEVRTTTNPPSNRATQLRE